MCAGGSLCQHDVVRNLLDVISHVSLNALNSEGSFCSSSWCGALEAGIVVAADHADGSRQRRKRKLKDNGHEQVPASHGAASKEAQRAKWANPKLQKKLLRCVVLLGSHIAASRTSSRPESNAFWISVSAYCFYTMYQY